MTPDEIGDAAALGVRRILGLAEGRPPPTAEPGLDPSLLLELLIVGVIPAVMAAGYEPLFPTTPVELPPCRAALLDRSDEPVVIRGAVGHLDLGGITGKPKAGPLGTGAGDRPEANDLQWLDGDTATLLAMPGNRHILRAIEHGGKHGLVATQLVQGPLAHIGAEMLNGVIDLLEWKVESELPHLLDQGHGSVGRTCATCQAVMDREAHVSSLGHRTRHRETAGSGVRKGYC